MKPGTPPSGYATIAFIGLIASLQHATGVVLILFPTLAALSYEVFTYPTGRWAAAPAKIIFTSWISACTGIVISRMVPFGTAAVLLETGLAVSVMRLTRSSVSPAISIGLLPVFLHVTSWLYPLTVTLGTSLLIMSSLALKRTHFATGQRLLLRPEAASTFSPPWRSSGSVYAVALTGLAYLATLSGERLIMYPPLAVLGFEMFTRPASCPWIVHLWKLPVAATFAALGGSLSALLLGPGVLAACAAMILGLVTLRGLNLHAPPVLAVCLLPLVMPSVGLNIVTDVALGTTLMTAAFSAWRRLAGFAGQACD